MSEVKARLSIEDLISEYVQLKRAGRNYKGLSPFTSEKTPSFVVSPEKQIWHDFSSGRGGDIFTFIQEVEGLDFRASLELLARKAGVDLDQFKESGTKSKFDKTRLQEALKLSVKFYQKHLLSKPEALNYILKKRAFSKQTVLDFQLGYSPQGPAALTDFLLKKGFKKEELKLVGLANQHGSRISDMFRGRIMVPLHDNFGNPVGFTARLLVDDEKAPKYINTPATPLYDKSRHIYGLHLAKQAIRQNDYSIMVEGNLDVIAAHQAGYNQTVATAGTALTEYQLKALSRLSGNVRLAFDQDRAGLEATERAIPIASKVGVNLSIITIPAGKDPDELIRKDVKLWGQAVKEAEYGVDWLIKTYQNKLDLTSAPGKKQFSDQIAKTLKDLADPVEQDHYIQQVAGLIGIDPAAFRKKLSGSQNSAPNRLRKTASIVKVNPKEELDRSRFADQLLCLCLMLPGTRGYLDLITDKMLVTEPQKAIFSFLKANPDFDGDLKKLSQLENVVNYVKILSLQFEELYAKVDTLELQYEAARLRARIIEYFVKQEKTKLSAQLASTDDSEHQAILTEASQLDKLLNQAKET